MHVLTSKWCRSFIRPFNLHLDTLKLRSWEIKVCFKPSKKFQVLHTYFFSVCQMGFSSDLNHKLEKKIRWQTEKKSGPLKKTFRCTGTEIFLRFETDLDLSKPWFSEIMVQIKRPTSTCILTYFFRYIQGWNLEFTWNPCFQLLALWWPMLL